MQDTLQIIQNHHQYIKLWFPTLQFADEASVPYEELKSGPKIVVHF